MPSFGDVTHEQLLDALAAVPDTVLLVDRELKIRFLNRIEEGFPTEAVGGASALDFISPEFRDEHRERLLRVLETGEEVDFEVPAVSVKGETEWYEGTLSPIYEDGDVSGVLIVTTNVTQRHLAQEEVKQLRRLIPVCSWCGKIRDDEGYWSSVEKFIEEKSGDRVTHGMCPECEGNIDKSGTDP